jgi:hypothetical protein
MGFVVDEVALVQVFLGVLGVFPVSIMPPMFHAHCSITDTKQPYK